MSNKIDKPWFSNRCRKLKRLKRNHGRLLDKNKKRPAEELRSSTRQYNKAKRSAISRFKNDIILSMKNKLLKNPKEWWKSLKKLSPLHNSNPDLGNSGISGNEWLRHFRNLLAPNTGEELMCLGPDDQSGDVKGVKQNYDFFHLNKGISNVEVEGAVKKLAEGKSTYFDSIDNTIIKCVQRAHPEFLAKLFSLILASEIFPSEWAKAYLSPLHKKGPKNSPENYRGIAISACLGKVYNSILNARLSIFMKLSGFFNDLQIGFMKGRRIADHVLVLQTLMAQAKRRRRSLFACFVDLKQAYDRVDRRKLYNKLITKGAPDKIVKSIMAQYGKVEYCVLKPGGRTGFFKTSMGLKQGDTMSPLLFNFFIMDLLPELYKSGQAPHLNGVKIPALLYADDAILLSESKAGLQGGLICLWNYCNANGLTVNTDKTKVMVLWSNAPKDISKLNILYGDSILDQVERFVYLGVEIRSNGKLHTDESPMLMKANRAQFKLSQTVYNLAFDTVLWLHERMVDPIISHGCEVWGPIGKGRKIKEFGIYESLRDEGKSELVGEKIRMRFLRLRTGVPKYSASLAVRGETGFRPIYPVVFARGLDYLALVEKEPRNSLLGCALVVEKELWAEGHDGWYGGLRAVLDNFNVRNPTVTRAWSSILKKDYDSNWNKHLWSNRAGVKSLSLFRELKPVVGLADYLKGPYEQHKKFTTRLRLAGHGLPVETGRHTKTIKACRICQWCDAGEIGDEFHLMRCSKLANERSHFEIFAKSKRDFIKVLRNPPLNYRLFFRDALKEKETVNRRGTN